MKFCRVASPTDEPVERRPLRVDARVELDPALLEEIEDAVSRHGVLAHVVRWACERTPPCELVGVVEQDEYTIDVVVRWPLAGGGAIHLVYDST